MSPLSTQSAVPSPSQSEANPPISTSSSHYYHIHNQPQHEQHEQRSIAIQPSSSSAPPFNPVETGLNQNTLISITLNDTWRDLPSLPHTAIPTSASDLPNLPSLPIATLKVKEWLANLNQSYHCVQSDEMLVDLQHVYGGNGMIDTTLAASRFRVFAVLYIAEVGKLKVDEHGLGDWELARLYKSLALRDLSNVTQHEDLTTVQALALLCLLNYYEPGGPNQALLVSLAMRTAVIINLHRRDQVYLPTVAPSFATETELQAHNERRKNIFWALYCLDRLSMFTQGHPPCIRDCDVDVELPSVPSPSAGGLVAFPEIFGGHNIRLRRLYGKIQESFYAVSVRPDQPMSESEAIVKDYVREIEEWYNSNPMRSAYVPISDATIARQVIDDISYHQMILAIHRPSPLIPHIPSSFVHTLLASASISLDLYRHYWSRKQVLIVWTHLYQIFTSCTTLLYAYCECRMRADLTEVPEEEVRRRISECRDLLSRFGPTWPDSTRYQVMFDTLAQYFDTTTEEISPTTTTRTTASTEPATTISSGYVNGEPVGTGFDTHSVFDVLSETTTIGQSAGPLSSHGNGDSDLLVHAFGNGSTTNTVEYMGEYSPSTIMRGFWVENAVPNAG
nr:uncharacterized protein CI109_004364 [Kwoniella shandongensis]KAA5527304.1 hypothetical protein CI109_004364 [Kwoniella shandongensis]